MSSSGTRSGEGRQPRRARQAQRHRRRGNGHVAHDKGNGKGKRIGTVARNGKGNGNGNGNGHVKTIEQPQSTSHRSGSSNGQVMTQRWEVKYVVDRRVRTALDRDLCALMDPDKYSARDGSYIVRSLYFDTPDYMAYHSKISGDAVRHKLRTRIYTDRPDEAKMVRLEIKSRYIGTVHKIATDVSIDDYKEIWRAAQQRILPPQRLLDLDRGVREFFRLQKLYNMEPKILVQYRRRAFERHDLSRVRANFDDNLVGSRHLDLLANIPNARRLLRYDHSVFEVKIDGVMPYWMHMLIDKYGLQNRAFSKFCYSIYSEARTSSILRDD